MNLGAEPKKIAILGGLVVIGGYIFYANVLSGPETETKKTPAPSFGAINAPAAPSPAQAPPNIRRAKVPVRGASQEFHPTLKPRPEDRPSNATIDPTLRLDLLAKVQSVEMQGGSRSLFQFASAPAPVSATPTHGVAAIHPKPRIIGPEPPP